MTWKCLGFSPENLNSYMLLNFDNGNKNKVVCLQNEDKAPSASWCHLSLHSNGQTWSVPLFFRNLLFPEWQECTQC